MTATRLNELAECLGAIVKECLDSGLTRHHAIARVSRISNDSTEYTVALRTMCAYVGSDDDWNERLVRAGYLPLRADDPFLVGMAA